MRKITGEQYQKEEIQRILSKGNKMTLLDRARLITLRNNVTITCWEYEKFLKERNEI